MRLVLLPLPSKPGEHIGIHAKAYQPLDGPVETPNLDVGHPRLSFGRIGEVDLRIGASGKPPQFPALLVSDRSGKDLARGDSPFLPG